LLKTIFILSIFLHSLTSLNLQSKDLCYDYRLLDGSEELYSYGMDTTNHWWAITKPFHNKYRLIVDGESLDMVNYVKPPVFSHNSQSWAAFAEDNLGLMIITKDSIISLNANDFGEILYSTISNNLIYSYFEGNNEVIVNNDKEVYVYNRYGKILVSPDGQKIAFMGRRGSKFIVNYNGYESSAYDNILPIGFMNDGNFYYAAENAGNWYIYKNEETFSELYYSIDNIHINREGTVISYTAVLSSGMMVAIMISDKFKDSYWESKRFDGIHSLTLHPYLPLIAFNAEYRTAKFIMFNNSKFFGGEYNSKPKFSHDGEDLLFFGCNISCFANLNGHKYPLKHSLNLNYNYAFKPGSKSFAYSTNSNMVVLFIESNMMHAGRMLDRLIAPRYNWRDKQYETLGEVNNRLYLLTCRMDD